MAIQPIYMAIKFQRGCPTALRIVQALDYWGWLLIIVLVQTSLPLISSPRLRQEWLLINWETVKPIHLVCTLSRSMLPVIGMIGAHTKDRRWLKQGWHSTAKTGLIQQ